VGVGGGEGTYGLQDRQSSGVVVGSGGDEQAAVVEAHPCAERGREAGGAAPGGGEVGPCTGRIAHPEANLGASDQGPHAVGGALGGVAHGLVDPREHGGDGQLELIALGGAVQVAEEAHGFGHQCDSGARVPLEEQHLAELCGHLGTDVGGHGVREAEGAGLVEALAGEGESPAADVDVGEPGLGACGGTPEVVGLGEVECGGERSPGTLGITGFRAGASEGEQAFDRGGRVHGGGVRHRGSRRDRPHPAILRGLAGSIPNADGQTWREAPSPGQELRMAEWQQGSRLPMVKTAVPGPTSQAWVDRLAQRECPGVTARRARRAASLGVASTDPIVWANAHGANVEDVDGNVFVDMTAGFGVASIGHAHPAVVGAMRAQSHHLLHAMGDAFPDRRRIELLEVLAEKTGLERAILGSSGSDAVEAALKTARLASGRDGVLAFHGSYHGLSYGALAATGYKREAFAAPFAGQLGSHVRHAHYGQPVHQLPWDGVGAVLVEPIQGRGGIRVPPSGWLAELVEAAHNNGAVVIFDEIYTGFGRTGAWLRAHTEGAQPDLVCLGKGMAGGYPISACVGTAAAMDAWGASKGEALHTQTFLGNPVGSAMALACIGVLETVVPTVEARGKALTERLEAAGFGVRGAGLLLGVSLPGTSTLAASRHLLQAGFIVLPAGEQAEVLALTPPLTIEDAQLDAFVDALVVACR